jgi:ABC-type sugar transport system ATPase subunit
MDYILEAENISKSFGGIQALQQVDFRLKCGEIHCLVGENGAGKSTLGKIIAGIHHPDEGVLRIQGEHHDALTPAQAKDLKIAMVTQELNLMPHLSIAENIFMFEDASYRGNLFLDREKINQEAEKLFEEFQISNMPPVDTRVGNLTIAQQQVVEIVKAISQDNHILIFDEPTTTLSINEVENLFTLIRRLKAQNVSVVLVTHRFNEIFEIGDLVTVLCDGRVVQGRIPVVELDDRALVKLMVGRDIKDFFGKKEDLELGPVILEVEGLSDGHYLEDISFEVREKEILGFAGLVGAGRTEIMETLFGIRSMTSGEIRLNGECLNKYPIKKRIKKGMLFVPEDRKNKGLAIKLPVDSNMNQVSMNLCGRFTVYERQFRRANKAMVQQLSIKHKDPAQRVNTLSGGNQQKVLLSKWLSQDSSVIIFDEPTRGIDVATKVEIYDLIKRLAREGKAIIMVSSELQELIAICDRIMVVNEGRLVAEFDTDDATEQKILSSAIPA